MTNADVKIGGTYTMKFNADPSYVVSGRTPGVIGYDYVKKGGVPVIVTVTVEEVVAYGRFMGRATSVVRQDNGHPYRFIDRAHAKSLASILRYTIKDDGSVKVA